MLYITKVRLKPELFHIILVPVQPIFSKLYLIGIKEVFDLSLGLVDEFVRLWSCFTNSNSHHVTDADAVDSTQHTNHTHHPPDLVDQNLAGIRAARTELDLSDWESDDNYRTPEPTHPRHGARTTDRNDPEGPRENRKPQFC